MPNPYDFTPPFERTVVLMACSRPSFWARVGKELDPEALADEANRHLLTSAQQLAQVLGRGPDSLVVVVQRVRGWVESGKSGWEVLEAVQDAVLDAPDLPSDETVLAELVPKLQKRIRREAVFTASSEHAGKGDLSKTRALIERADDLAKPKAGAHIVELGPEAFVEIERIKFLKRLPTGIFDLDNALDGGLWGGALGVVVGAAGEGKSFALSHFAAEACREGHSVLLVTLELPVAIQQARVISNVTGVPVMEVLDGHNTRARAAWDATQVRGKLHVSELAPYASTVSDVFEAVEQVEQRSGRPVDVLVVDYGDKLGSRKKDSSDYATGRDVFEGLRHYVEGRRMWGWTASQARRKSSDKKSKFKDLDDVADSMHKVRVADVVITLNGEEDVNGERCLTLFVAKNRVGEGRQKIGPIEVDFGMGRLVVR